MASTRSGRFDKANDRYGFAVAVTGILVVLLVGEFNARAVLMRTHAATAYPGLLMASISFALVGVTMTAALAEPLARAEPTEGADPSNGGHDPPPAS